MSGSIVLCGFMGCGKTTVGRRAAKLLKWDFYDLDFFIEEKAGLTVAEIFQNYGEEGFREMETQAAKEISQKGNAVIACGGGTVLFSQNVEAFHQNGGTIILLDAPLAVLQERLKHDKKRPLLQKPNRNEVIANLYRERLPLYRAAADLEIKAGAPFWIVAKKVAAVGRASPGEKWKNLDKSERKRKI